MANYDQPEYSIPSASMVSSKYLRDLQTDEPPVVQAVRRVREGFDKVGILRREDMSTPDLLQYTWALLNECDQAIAEMSWEDGIRPRVFLSTAQDNIDVLIKRLNSEARDG